MSFDCMLASSDNTQIVNNFSFHFIPLEAQFATHDFVVDSYQGIG